MKDFIAQHINDDVRLLALQRDRYPHIDLPYAVSQIAGRQRIREKLPAIYANLDWILPITLSLEQCSSQATALYKQSILRQLGLSDRLVDLTGGAGIDCYYCSRLFRRVDYVERNPELCKQAEHNLGIRIDDSYDSIPQIQVHCTDSTDYLHDIDHASVILIDPARRDGMGRKVAGLADCTPDLTQIHDTLVRRADHVLVKLSPMLDMHEAIRQLPTTREVWIISVRGECKEMLLRLSIHDNPDPHAIHIHCVNLQTHESDFDYIIRA